MLEFEKSAGRLLLEALRKKRGTETPPAGVSAALDAIRNLKPAWKKLATLSEGTICLSQLLNAKPTRWNRRRLAVQLAERAADLREKVNEILVLTATPNPLAEGETVSENLKGRFSTEGSTKETQALWERGNAWAISPGSIISFSRVSALMRRSIRTLRRSES